jgi:hypothetical protein
MENTVAPTALQALQVLASDQQIGSNGAVLVDTM